MEFLSEKENFCLLPKEFSNYEKSKVTILPVPCEGTVTYGKGASKGPDAIIKASHEVELLDEELNKENYEVGICTLKPLQIEKSPEIMNKWVFQITQKIINDNKFLIMLGGEHSISSACVKAFKEKFPKLSVLQLDAHTDLRDSYEGSKYSHASVMARVAEICSFVQIGIRSTSEEEPEAVKKNIDNIFWAHKIINNEEWFDKAISKLSGDVYITIDVDVFDPSIMPSTGTPEPGGLLWYQTLRFLKKVFQEKNVVGFDVCELAPIKGLHAPDFLCAKLIYRLIGYKFMK